MKWSEAFSFAVVLLVLPGFAAHMETKFGRAGTIGMRVLSLILWLALFTVALEHTVEAVEWGVGRLRGLLGGEQ